VLDACGAAVGIAVAWTPVSGVSVGAVVGTGIAVSGVSVGAVVGHVGKTNGVEVGVSVHDNVAVMTCAVAQATGDPSVGRTGFSLSPELKLQPASVNTMSSPPTPMYR
jgi:hypothetical protein